MSTPLCSYLSSLISDGIIVYERTEWNQRRDYSVINLEKSNEIIKRRALSFSYDDIADLTEVSKPAVMKICKERKADIEDSKRFASAQTNSDISEAVLNRKIIYNTLLYKTSSELMRRDLSTMKVSELATLIGSLERSLCVLENNNATRTTNPFVNYSDEDLEKVLCISGTPAIEIQETAD